MPNDLEWSALTSFLVNSIVRSKLKEIGTVHWDSPNEGRANENSFTALPGGYRNGAGDFGGMKKVGCWWSSSEYSFNNAIPRAMTSDTSIVFSNVSEYKGIGFSIRCVKDSK